MEPFIGQIILFAGNFAPRGWALCDGQLLDIASHSALFDILGTTYGGDGNTTFGLPDLRGRAPVHVGHGPGLSNYTLGERTGTETVTLGRGDAALIDSHEVHRMSNSGLGDVEYLALGISRGTGGKTVVVDGYDSAPQSGPACSS